MTDYPVLNLLLAALLGLLVPVFLFVLYVLFDDFFHKSSSNDDPYKDDREKGE